MQSIYQKILANLNTDKELDSDFSIRGIAYGLDPYIYDGAEDVFFYFYGRHYDNVISNYEKYSSLLLDLNIKDEILSIQSETESIQKIKNIFSEISLLLNEDGTVKILEVIYKYLPQIVEFDNYKIIHKVLIEILSDSRDIELIKFALAMLSKTPSELEEEDKNIIRILGLCNEFTLYASYIMEQWSNGKVELFELAKKVNGWGRTILIPKLDLQEIDVSNWLLESGWDNYARPEYQANVILSYSSLAKIIKNKDIKMQEYDNFCQIIYNAIKIEPGVIRLLDIKPNIQLNIIKLWLNEFKKQELTSRSILLFIVIFKMYKNVAQYIKENEPIDIDKEDKIDPEKYKYYFTYAPFYDVEEDLDDLVDELEQLYDFKLFEDVIQEGNIEVEHYFYASLGSINIDNEFRQAMMNNPEAYLPIVNLLLLQRHPQTEFFLDYYAEILPLVKIAEGPNTPRAKAELSDDERLLSKVLETIRYAIGIGREFIIASLQSSSVSLRLSALSNLSLCLKLSQKNINEYDSEIAKLLHILIQYEDNPYAMRKELEILNKI